MTDHRIDWLLASDESRELDAAHEEAAAAAAKRVDFQLTYDRSAERREFTRNELDGPSMPNAYGKGTQVGEWSDFDDPDAPTVEAWVDKYARMAINEAVHEALEWFRVDGKQWIDPHSMEHEGAVFDAVNDLCARLAALRNATTNESGRTE